MLNPLSANPEKWSNTLKQIVGNSPTICLSVFDHFMNLALKGFKVIHPNVLWDKICKNGPNTTYRWQPEKNLKVHGLS